MFFEIRDRPLVADSRPKAVPTKGLRHSSGPVRTGEPTTSAEKKWAREGGARRHRCNGRQYSCRQQNLDSDDITGVSELTNVDVTGYTFIPVQDSRTPSPAVEPKAPLSQREYVSGTPDVEPFPKGTGPARRQEHQSTWVGRASSPGTWVPKHRQSLVDKSPGTTGSPHPSRDGPGHGTQGCPTTTGRVVTPLRGVGGVGVDEEGPRIPGISDGARDPSLGWDPTKTSLWSRRGSSGARVHPYFGSRRVSAHGEDATHTPKRVPWTAPAGPSPSAPAEPLSVTSPLGC